MMEKFKGTKGPWHKNGLNGIQSAGGFIIGIASKDGVLDKETISRNTTLMSTSPELLETLEYGVELIEYLINALPTGKVRNAACDWNIIARSTINKALGI